MSKVTKHRWTTDDLKVAAIGFPAMIIMAGSLVFSVIGFPNATVSDAKTGAPTPVLTMEECDRQRLACPTSN